jgi:hypothetical protein
LTVLNWATFAFDFEIGTALEKANVGKSVFILTPYLTPPKTKTAIIGWITAVSKIYL